MRGRIASLCCFVLAISCGGSRRAASGPIAEVEPQFDTPREYRRHAPLPCGVGSGLIYVFTTSGELYAFEPPTLRFRRIGLISCPGAPRGLVHPNSMAVDRAGTAWINYVNGPIYAVSTRDASCKATPYEPGQHGFTHLGMAFVSTGPTLSGETLFISAGGNDLVSASAAVRVAAAAALRASRTANASSPSRSSTVV